MLKATLRSIHRAALLRVAESVARGSEPVDVAATITEEIGVLLGASRVCVRTVDSEGSRETVASWAGEGAELDQPDLRRFGLSVRLVDDRIDIEIVVGVTPGFGLPVAINVLLDEFLELFSLSIVNADARRALSSSRARLLHAGDEERRVIERALQLGPGRLLRQTGDELRLVLEQVPVEPDGAAGLLREARETLNTAMSQLQTLARGIHPVLLTERGLDMALADLVSNTCPGATLRSAVERRVGPAIELGAYRIVAGALNEVVDRTWNAVTVVEVRLDGPVLVIEVADPEVGGPGLYSAPSQQLLRDRAGALGGELEIQARPDSGTVLRVRIPVTDSGELVPVPVLGPAVADGPRPLVAAGDQTEVLLRVATLVAHNRGSFGVFEAIAEELGRALGALTTNVIRFDADGMLTVMSAWNLPGELRYAPIGSRFAITASEGTSLLVETRAAVNIDKVDPKRTLVPELVARMKTEAAGFLPLFVRGRLWGEVLATAVDPPVLRPDQDGFIARLLELITISIDNAQTEADLSASRSQVVQASDGTRRRIERNLHDGAQQQFVSVAINLQLVQIMVERGDGGAAALLQDALANLDAGLAELLRLTRGIRPSLLSEAGLQDALQTLTDSSDTPATLSFDADRTVEHATGLATYYVVSEALTNIAKHAQARAAHVDINDRDGVLEIVVSDNGRGGASDRRGSGLAGLRDRAHALGGSLTLDSDPDHGTTVSVTLPSVVTQHEVAAQF